MGMPDGNSAAERQYSASQARSEQRHDAYGDRVIESIIDDLFSGSKVDGLTLHDFCEESLTFEDMGALLLANNRDDQVARLDALKKKVTDGIRTWCEGRGSDEVDERVRSWEESDRSDAMEARHAVAEAI